MQNSVANPAFKLKGKATATSPMRSVSEPGYEKGAAGGYLHPDAADHMLLAPKKRHSALMLVNSKHQIRFRKSVKVIGDKRRNKWNKEKGKKSEMSGLRSTAALSFVLLKQGNAELNLRGNFRNDSFNSLIDETTGIMTMFTVYKDFEDTQTIFYAAIGIYAVNALMRIVIGLKRLTPKKKKKTGANSGDGDDVIVRLTQYAQNNPEEENGSIKCGTWFRLICGMVLIIIEPVAGIRLLDSAFEPAPALTEDHKKELERVRVEAERLCNESDTKIAVAKEKAAEAEVVQDLAKDMEDDASRKVAEELAKCRKREVEVVNLEADYIKEASAILQEESDLKFAEAEVARRERIYQLEKQKLQGTELVELVMAVFEDIPELALAITFAAKGGLNGSSQADISLFVTSQVISLFHAAKCFWSFWTLRQVIKDSKQTNIGALETYDNYFEGRTPEIDGTKAALENLEERKEVNESIPKEEAESARREWDLEFERINSIVSKLTGKGSESLKNEIEAMKKSEALRKAELEAAQNLQAEKEEKATLCYWGRISSKDANDLLRDKADGTFLVRASDEGVYTIDVVQAGQVKNIPVLIVDGGYCINSNDLPCTTLEKLILKNQVSRWQVLSKRMSSIKAVNSSRGLVVKPVDQDTKLLTPLERSWNWGSISEKDAAVELDGKDEGTFLIRKSGKNTFAIHSVESGEVKHEQIRKNAHGFVCKTLSTKADEEETLEDLILEIQGREKNKGGKTVKQWTIPWVRPYVGAEPYKRTLYSSFAPPVFKDTAGIHDGASVC